MPARSMYLFLSVDICTAEYWCGDLQGYEAGPDELFLVDLPVLLISNIFLLRPKLFDNHNKIQNQSAINS